MLRGQPVSATIRDVEYEVGAALDTGVAGITLHGTSSGGLWPGLERPGGVGDIPTEPLFLYVVSRPSPQRRIFGGSSSGQLHQVFLRLLGVSAEPGDYSAPWALVSAAANFLHYNKDAINAEVSGTPYCDCLIAQGPVMQPVQDTNELARVYVDFQVDYSE